MTDARRAEIDANYDFFQRNLSKYLLTHPGEYALLKGKRVIDFYALPGDAYRAGLAQFEDEPFSIQEVRSEPIELGHFAFDPR